MGNLGNLLCGSYRGIKFCDIARSSLLYCTDFKKLHELHLSDGFSEFLLYFTFLYSLVLASRLQFILLLSWFFSI